MTQLPIYNVIADIQKALLDGDDLILKAPPGAGKTTVVPLALLDQKWLKGKILVLEPRRMAARAAAARMAQTLKEKVGERVGYRIRQDTRVSLKTKIEVVTGGVLIRLLQNDPSLEDYSLIIFDEFHERNLDSDLGLALALHGRSIFREEDQPLKLLIMSATLSGQEISELLNHAPIISSEGRMFPVEAIYTGSTKLSTLVDQVYNTTLIALREQQGSLLVFLPGQKEILALQNKLKNQVGSRVKIAPLYGNLSLAEQQQAIAPIDIQKNEYDRKIVISTDIAETSLTIDGVTVIIDSGYRREPVFDPRTGLTRLQTVRISQASSTQRMGRAGRLAPGVCYRVWSQEDSLPAFSKAEIEQADLAPLVLQTLAFGININSNINSNDEAQDDTLQWLTPPPQGAFNQAIDLLKSLGATATTPAGLCLTKHGEQLAHFPSHPRLAHMMIQGAVSGLAPESTILAAALTEPGKPDSLGNDIEQWASLIQNRRNSRHPWFQRVHKQAKSYQFTLNKIKALLPAPTNTPTGFLLALAYPDRIAKKRVSGGNVYQLSNGRSATISQGSLLARYDWLCIAEIGGSSLSSEDRIYTATQLNPMLFEDALKHEIIIDEYMEWDEQQNRFIAEKRWCISNIIWKSQKNLKVSLEQKRKVISQLIRQKGLGILAFNADALQWCARVELLRQQKSCHKQGQPEWPDVSPNGLVDSLGIWLEPHLDSITTLQGLKRLDIKNLLTSLLPWPLSQRLDEWAPTHFKVPSGSNIVIDYTLNPPVLAVKLQEMFGCETTPCIANSSVLLLVHLLSPARKPLQLTQDLAGFWRSSYHDVKKEMKGRYPKHPWPDDPLVALATRHTKRRLGTPGT